MAKAKAKKLTAIKSDETEAAIVVATAAKVGHLLLSRENDLTKRLAERAWLAKCQEEHMPCLTVSVLGNLPGRAHVEAAYGYLGTINSSNFEFIVKTICGVDGVDRCVEFVGGGWQCGFREDDNEYHSRIDAPERILVGMLVDAIPDVCRLLKDLILDFAH